MSALPPVHRTSVNRELAEAVRPRVSIARPGYRKLDKRVLALNLFVYFAAIGVIGWFVLSQGQMVTPPSRAETLAALEGSGTAPGRVLARAIADGSASQSDPTVATLQGEEYLGRAPGSQSEDDYWAPQEPIAPARARDSILNHY